MKKIFFIIAALCACTLFTFAHDFEVDGIYYNFLGGDSVSVTYRGSSSSSYSNEYSGTVTIPEIVEYNSTTYRVTSIGYSAFYNCSSLTEITIPNSVTSIGNYVFEYCSSLTAITIPNSVTTIGRGAFYECSSLTAITIPNSVSTIGHFAFYSCSNLTSVAIGENVASIGSGVFQGCSSLTSVIWNAKHCENFTPYDGTPFYRYYSNGSSNNFNIGPQITSFTFGDSVQHIPAYLCYDMNKLATITIPKNVTSIGEHAFEKCSSITAITIPQSVASVGSCVFRACSGLTSIVWNAKNCVGISTEDTPFYFYCSGCEENFNLGPQITSFTFGDSVQHIPSQICYDMNKLTTITIPQSVTSFGSRVFQRCSALTSVIWNAKHCEDFTSDSTPFYYDYGSYRYNTNFDIRPNITSFIFGDSVQYIPAYLCYGMKNLATLTIPNENVRIGDYAFSECAEKFYNRFDNAKYLTIGKNKYHTLIAAKDKTITSCIIHSKTIAIGPYAFEECIQLTDIEIPASITTIGRSAFYNCVGLTAITIPNSITNIYPYAFSGCENITQTNYTGDIASWCGIGFGNATSNPIYHSHNLYINDVQVTNLVIPDSVTTIGDYVFYDCDSLTAVSIPNSITTIGYGAFSDCNFGYLILPESLDSISKSSFANNTNLAAVKLEALTPPACNSSFGNINKEIPLYVPCSSIDAYWSSKWAKEFNNIVESDFLFVAQSEDKNKGEVVVMMSPTCDEPIAMVRVEPKEGYTFVAWNDGNTETMRTVEVTKDVVYTAHFAALNGSDTTTVKDSVEIETTASTANLAWTLNPQAYYYALHVFTDAAMTDTVCKMTFDANGNILTKNATERHIAPKHATQAGSSTLNCVVTGLETGKTYTYMLRSLDCNDIILETEIGTFQPTATTPVTGITLDKSSLELFVGATEQITATIIPATASNKNIQWTSDNEGVATVANGLITAVAKGETTITATTEDGDLTATCIVTVKDETALDNVSADGTSHVQKVLEDGTIYIIRNGKRYTLDGREVSTM